MSAVPGSKKALPIASSIGYWQTAGHVVCEVDALEGRVAQGGGGPGWYPTNVDGAFHNMDWFEGQGHMPLPDEDDADL